MGIHILSTCIAIALLHPFAQRFGKHCTLYLKAIQREPMRSKVRGTVDAISLTTNMGSYYKLWACIFNRETLPKTTYRRRTSNDKSAH